MGMGKLDKSNRIQQQRQDAPPTYRNEKGDCQCSVWDGRRNGVYYLQAKFSRKYIDGQGRQQFTTSFEFNHMEDLIELMKEVQKDMAQAISEESGNGGGGVDLDELNKHM